MVGLENISDIQGYVLAIDELCESQQDLGMMGHRTGREVNNNVQGQAADTMTIVNHDAQPLSDLPQLIPQLTVLLGDPRLPCVGKLNNIWNEEDFAVREKLIEAIYELGFEPGQVVVLDDHRQLKESLLQSSTSPKRPTFVFNLCDEGFFNDASKELHIPALLEMLQVPYTGAGPVCLGICYDKQITNRTADAIGVPTPREQFISGKDAVKQFAVPGSAPYKLIHQDVQYPSFIKPTQGDNSLGITVRSIVHSPTDVIEYARELLDKYGIHDMILQEYLPGPEYSVCAIGNPESDPFSPMPKGLRFLPILEVDFTKICSKGLAPILGYESKWDPSSAYWTDVQYVRAALTQEQKESLERYAYALFLRFGCRDYARFDFRSDGQGVIKLLEVNPNPGWQCDGKISLMAKLEGTSYAKIIGEILEASHRRLFPSKQRFSLNNNYSE